MPEERFPLLHSHSVHVSAYRSPKGGGGDAKAPPRNPRSHARALLQQLDTIAAKVGERTGTQVPGAKRALVTVKPEPGYELAVDSLADRRSDVRIVSVDPETKAVVLDTPDAELKYLRRKLAAFADPAKINKKSKKHANTDALAPIAEVSISSEADLAGPRFSTGTQATGKQWFELACRGGARRAIGDSENTLRQLSEALGSSPLHQFMAAERLLIFVRLTVPELRDLLTRTDCVLDFDIAGPDVRDWLIMQDGLNGPVDLSRFAATPPPPDAPSVAYLDTGVASLHPMLKDALLSAHSVAPGDSSPEDIQGHGTMTGGVCLYEDVTAAALAQATSHSHWIQSVKILRRDRQGSAADSERVYWPQTTVLAVEAAEGVRNAPIVFSMAVTAPNDLAGAPTSWSDAVDQIAFNNGRGRLFLVSAGNADTTDLSLVTGYPQLNLREKIEDPAQAFNALTVGATTFKTTLPPDAAYAAYRPLAPHGGLSPHSRVGHRASPIKPEIVFEGGNVAYDGQVPDATIETLTSVTTRREWRTHPLTTMHATSLATANAARFAARLLAEAPDLTPQLLRGLIVHSAQWTPAILTQFANLDERLEAVGYGAPSFDKASSCARERATIVVEDRLPNAKFSKLPERNPAKPDQLYRQREVRYCRLPVPEEVLRQHQDVPVTLTVTLSYFAEPNTVRRRVYRGMDLAWDMQGPLESPEEFQRRINRLMREPKSIPTTRSFDWDIGKQRRSRGTVQSDRWHGRAGLLVRDLLIAVYPVLGWWDDRKELASADAQYALIVSLEAPGLDIYTPISVALTPQVVIET